MLAGNIVNYLIQHQIGRYIIIKIMNNIIIIIITKLEIKMHGIPLTN